MNVLLIGLEDAVPSGSIQRQLEYAKLLSNYYIIERSKRGKGPRNTKLADNLYIFYTSSINKISFIYDAFRIGRRICEEQTIDCISCQDPFSCGLVGYLLKKRYKIPLNIHIQADVTDNRFFISERKLNYFLNKLSKWVIRKADTVRVVNSKQKEKLAKLGIADKKIWHIPCFIDFDLFLQNNGDQIKQQYLTDKIDRLVLYTGRLAKQKDLGTLIHAIPLVIRRYSNVLFLIIGTGPEGRKIKKLVLKLGIKDNVCFLGKVPYDKIPHFFSACDLFVLTSVYEGTPLVLLEAAASGKPAVSTCTSGAYDTIIDGSTGYIVDFRHPRQIAERLLYLLEHPKIAQEIGARAREFVLAGFKKDNIIGRYIKMWQDTCRHNLCAS